MHDFIKYYSYNQLIEDFDVLVMSEQEYLANKHILDNPQKIILVNREGGPKPPKIPLWFKSYKEQTDKKFDSINNKFEDIDRKFKDIDKKFEQMDTKAPTWFVEFMINFAKKNNLKL